MNIKDEIIGMLERSRGEEISGQQLADSLGVTRAAVCKAVNRLRSEGHLISSSPRRGYMLENGSDRLTVQGIKQFLPERYSGLEVIVLDTVDSTNSYAKRLVASGCGECIIAANEQTAGRGRLGKSFYSPADTGLYMSVVLRPDRPVSELLMVTVFTAVAVCRTIERFTGERASIKWVNDIFIGSRKVCGILTEAVSDLETATAEAVIVGVGINVTTRSFPGAVAQTAASIGSGGISRARLAAETAAAVKDIAQCANRDELMEEYRRRSLIIGREISWSSGSGRAVDINDEGNLVVESGGETVVLRSGEVSLGSAGIAAALADERS